MNHKEKRHYNVKTESTHAEAASAFFGAFSFLGAAFLGAAFLVTAGLAVFVTRPDLVLVRTAGFSTTAGA